MCERLGVSSLFDHAEWIRQEADKNHLAIFRKKRLRPFRRFQWMPVSTWEAIALRVPSPLLPEPQECKLHALALVRPQDLAQGRVDGDRLRSGRALSTALLDLSPAVFGPLGSRVVPYY